MLTQCLGPEEPGHIRGVSSYNGWKEAWSGHLGMYRKRRKISSADLQTIKDELRAEVTQDILSMLAKQGLQIVPLSRNTSPAPGRRSNCGSVSEAAKGQNDGPLLYIEDEDVDPMRMSPDEDHDIISGLSEPTLCALIHSVGGHRAEVAWGTVYPR